MRIIEPTKQRHKRARRSRRVPLMFGMVLLIGAGIWLSTRRVASPAPESNSTSQTDVNSDTAQQPTQTDIAQPSAEPRLIEFSDNEFKALYNNTLMPQTTRIENPPSITGNETADARIRQLAENRGYRLRQSPTVELTPFEGHYLQEPVITSWQGLRTAATKAGLQLSLVSAYRSVETQRALFLQRLADTGASVESVAAGTADAQVDQVLKTSSIPGYSRHHTGYTVDLQCGGYEFENFVNSSCQAWIAADNYKVAKEFGFIPSYPPLAGIQGPDPEAWEYVWMGTDLLYTTQR